MCNPITTARPEALLANGTHAGYEWEVTSNRLGFRCGYVRVPPGHPWHGKDHDDVDAEVHGGLTFAEADEHCGKGGPDDAWWLGFDCAHAGDAPDPALPGGHRLAVLSEIYNDFPSYATIRTTEYVSGQCRRLIDQAVLSVMDIPGK